jgi:hypothetical protein
MRGHAMGICGTDGRWRGHRFSVAAMIFAVSKRSWASTSAATNVPTANGSGSAKFFLAGSRAHRAERNSCAEFDASGNGAAILAGVIRSTPALFAGHET